MASRSSASDSNGNNSSSLQEQVVRGHRRGRSKSRRGNIKRRRSSDSVDRSRSSSSKGRGRGSWHSINAIMQIEKERLQEKRRQRQTELRELAETYTEERLRRLVADVIDRAAVQPVG